MLPTDEILRKYFNTTRLQLHAKCVVRDKCAAALLIIMEGGKGNAGENLINHLVVEAKRLTSVTETVWNRLLQSHCSNSPFLVTFLQMTVSNVRKCLSPAEIPSADTFRRASEEYTRIYCSRVKDL